MFSRKKERNKQQKALNEGEEMGRGRGGNGRGRGGKRRREERRGRGGRGGGGLLYIPPFFSLLCSRLLT